METPDHPNPQGELELTRTSFTLAVFWFIGLESAIRFHRLGLYIAAGLGVLLIIWAALLWRRGRATNVSALALFAHLPTSLAAMSFIGGVWAQHAVAIISAALIWFIIRQQRRSHDDLRGRTMAFITAVITWFGWFALLSAGVYLNVSPLGMIAAGGLLSAAAALLVWIESGLPWQTIRLGLLAVGWFGAELFTLVWWLPTALLVGSVVGATIIVLVVQATRHLWENQWESGRGRRYLLVGSIVCLVVLTTARWI